MNLLKISLYSFCFMVSSCETNENKFSNTELPNIILIMSDDMGYSDIPLTVEKLTSNLSNLAKWNKNEFIMLLDVVQRVHYIN